MSFELMDEMLFVFYCLETFANNILFIDPNDFKYYHFMRLDETNPMNPKSSKSDHWFPKCYNICEF